MTNKNKNFKKLLFLFLTLLILAGLFGFKKTVLASEKIIITEIMYSPEGTDAKHEWLEIFNSGDELIDLSDWTFFEANTNHKLTLYQGTFNLDPKNYAIIADDAPTFLIDHSGHTGTVLDSTFSLHNSGEVLAIKNDSGDINYEMSYADSLGADGNGFSLEMDALVNFRESYVVGGTPGKENSKKPTPKNYSDKILLNELLPAPSSGNDEYIELYNSTAKDIDISGYVLKDASKGGKYVFPGGTSVRPADYLTVYKKDFKFALNNSGTESVTLFTPDEKAISTVSYSGSKTGVSYNFDGSGWRWSKLLTPGKENKFNNLPEVSKKKDNKIYVDVYADFSAKGYDADKDKLKFTWDFGDGHKSYKKETRHKFKKAGKYRVTLKVSDGSEDKFEIFNIKVEKFPKSKVKIVSVSPNPKGKDSDAEYIVLQNKSKKKINLKDWIVATGSKNLYNHPITEDIIIKPGELLRLTREFSKFTLNNKKAKIELRYPDGKVSSKLAYDKKKTGVKENEIYTKESGQWAWVAPKAEVKLAVAEKPIQVEAKPQLTEPIVLATSGKNFSKDESLQKNASAKFSEPQGIVLGVATFRPAFSRNYPVQNKHSYLEIIFAALNSFFNHFINIVFLKL